MHWTSTFAILLLATAGAAHGTGFAPSIFAAGPISGPAHDSAPTFAPGGDTVYFGRSNAQQSTILVSQRRGDGWSEPRIAPFSGTWNDMEPALSPDGRFLVFVSNRPDRPGGAAVVGFFNGSEQRGGRLWRVAREGDGWGAPVHLGDDVNTRKSDAEPRLGADGRTLYFSSERTVAVGFPRTRAQAEADHARMLAWDNGNDNIWQVPLAPLLDRARPEEPSGM